MVTRTRCSSMPSAETFRKPAGSTRTTLPSDGLSAPAVDPDGRADLDLDRVGREQVSHDLQIERVADIYQGASQAGTVASLSWTIFSTRPLAGASTRTQHVGSADAAALAGSISRAAKLVRTARRIST